MKTIIVALFTITVAVARGEIVTVGKLTIEIPAGFKQEAKQEKDPDGDGEVNRWKAQEGRDIEILYYTTLPKHDGGPMIVAAEEDIEIAGQKTKLIETKMFFGLTRKVFEVCLRDGESSYIIYSERMSKDEFKRLILGARFTKKASNNSVEPTRKPAGASGSP